MSEQTELLPCPFCGAAPTMSDGKISSIWVIWCENIDCDVGCETSAVDKDDAVASWNTRAPAQPVAPISISDAMVERALEAWFSGPARSRGEAELKRDMKSAIAAALVPHDRSGEAR